MDSKCPDCGADGERVERCVVTKPEALVFVEPYWRCTNERCGGRWEDEKGS